MFTPMTSLRVTSGPPELRVQRRIRLHETVHQPARLRPNDPNALHRPPSRCIESHRAMAMASWPTRN